MNPSKLTTIALSALLAAAGGLGGLAGCATPPTSLKPSSAGKAYLEDPTQDPSQKQGAFNGGEKNTFDHFADLGSYGSRDPFDILAQREEEGPAEIRTRLHSCQKLQYEALGNLLTSLGVNLDATGTPPSAGQLYKGGAGALGVANYDARVGEAITWSSAGAAKLFDVFVQAAPEIIANLGTVPQCQEGGAGPSMFDDQNRCTRDALTCIMGRPATQAQVDVCSHLVTEASDVGTGKNLAVATVLSATHSCE